MKRALLCLALLFAGAAHAGNYVGDYALGDTVDCKFGTVRPSSGASFTLAGTPVISAYVDNSTTQITAGITTSADFDGVTGLNNVRVAATAANGYTSGTFIALVITTGTVDSVSVTGQPVCSFTLRKVNLGTTIRGTLSGTHTATTADLGTAAPGATSQVPGMTLVIPAKFFAAVITSYNTGTGVATFSPATALTLQDADAWELWPTPSAVFATDSINAGALAADAAAEVAAANAAAQKVLTGTCDSGSTTTCVDNALTQASATQLEDRLICFDDDWCGLITTFTPGTDTATTTKIAPSTRASKVYTIFPTTLE